MKDEDAPIILVRTIAAIQRKQPMPIGRNWLKAGVRYHGPVGGFPGFSGHSDCEMDHCS